MRTVKRLIPATERDRAIELLANFVRHYLPGKDLSVDIEEVAEERTGKQRRALFGVAYKSLMEQMGLAGEREKDQLHEMMCGEYWGWTWSLTLGARSRVPVRTTTRNERGERDVLSVRQQMAFYAWLQRRAAEYGYEIPDPEPEFFRRAEDRKSVV